MSDTLTGSKPQPDKDLVDGDRGVGLSHETTDAKNTFGICCLYPGRLELNNIGQSISTPAGTRDEITKETISQSGQEPPSGYSGTGTAVDPYDGGNQPGKPPFMLLPDFSFPFQQRTMGKILSKR